MLNNDRKPVTSVEKVIIEVEGRVPPDVFLELITVRGPGARDAQGEIPAISVLLRRRKLAVTHSLRDLSLVHLGAAHRDLDTGVQGAGQGHISSCGSHVSPVSNRPCSDFVLQAQRYSLSHLQLSSLPV